MFEDNANKIKLLMLDVDGVMTDGRIVIDDEGRELKFFNVKDGQGLRLLMRSGVEIVIISGRESASVDHRAAKLGIGEVYQGVNDKGALCDRLIEQKGLLKDQIAFIGDDLIDLPIFGKVKFPIAVADAVEEVREAACYITKNKGGEGAVREVCEIILKRQGTWDGIVESFRERGK